MHDFNLLSPGLWYEKIKLAMNAGIGLSFYLGHALTAARLAQLGEGRSLLAGGRRFKSRPDQHSGSLNN